MLPYVELVIQQGFADCGIASLAMLTGRPYADVLTSAVTTQKAAPHKGGMKTKQIIATAARLGLKMALRRTFDIEQDCGLLSVERITPKVNQWMQHMVLLKWGLVFDTDGKVWEPDVFFVQHGFRPLSLLVVLGGTTE